MVDKAPRGENISTVYVEKNISWSITSMHLEIYWDQKIVAGPELINSYWATVIIWSVGLVNYT